MQLSTNVPMYSAFFVHGADCVPSTEHVNGLVEAAVKQDCGFWEYVNDMIGHAEKMHGIVLLALTVYGDETGFPGVFEYEVCEEFGKWYVETTLKNYALHKGEWNRHQFVPTYEECEDWMRKAVCEFFCQCESEERQAALRAALLTKD